MPTRHAICLPASKCSVRPWMPSAFLPLGIPSSSRTSRGPDSQPGCCGTLGCLEILLGCRGAPRSVRSAVLLLSGARPRLARPLARFQVGTGSIENAWTGGSPPGSLPGASCSALPFHSQNGREAKLAFSRQGLEPRKVESRRLKAFQPRQGSRGETGARRVHCAEQTPVADGARETWPGGTNTTQVS